MAGVERIPSAAADATRIGCADRGFGRIFDGFLGHGEGSFASLHPIWGLAR